ncbi:MAG: hypothetical protein JW984_13525 [Deltaproteobacteria bacterium]|uniref:Uncharacterized protein n=1 Tax=Candidatus Zymogenus saltonus TaxID=2844893 RepID=A0A9D8KHI6_9DELT|nr:hypothetical protein [Candidatus Zymogenus saltonus]
MTLVITGYVASTIFFIVLVFIIYRSRRAKMKAQPLYPGQAKVGLFTGRAKKALIAFAQTRGLTIIPDDRSGDLNARITQSFGLPDMGNIEDIVKIPLSNGEGYLYTRFQETSDSSSETASVSESQYIVVFTDIPIAERTFVVQHIPLKGRLAKAVINLVLNKVFGAGNVELMEIEERFPDFAKVYNVFTEDVEGAERAILTADVMLVLMTHPGNKPANVCFAPSGFGIVIETKMKRAEEIERYVTWSETLARALSDMGKF